MAELPQASVAVHLRVILYVSGQGPGAVVSEKTMAGDGSQLSVAVGATAAGTEPQSTVRFAGTPAKTGGKASPTETCCEAVAELPQLSVATQILVIR